MFMASSPLRFESLRGWAVRKVSNLVSLLRTQKSRKSLHVESAGLAWNLVIPPGPCARRPVPRVGMMVASPLLPVCLWK